MTIDTLPTRVTPLTPLLRPVQAFLSAESAGGIVLIVSAVAAMLVANSPLREAYDHFWHLKLSVGVGSLAHAMSLHHWVNDGLMALFFLMVGLEIKRELLLGELASARRAALPIAAAVGGMVVPAGLYAALNYGGPGAAGWGIPMATDIAFAVGVLALVAQSVPAAVKVFLLALAIVDDLGAVLVIALFYASDVSIPALGGAGVLLAGLVALNALGVHRPLPYMILGVLMWAATLYSGIHATVAGVLLALTIPATRRVEEQPFVGYVRGMLDRFERHSAEAPDLITDDQSHALKAMEEASQAVQTPLAMVEHALLKPVNFLVVPLFALANAGVSLESVGSQVLNSRTMWGVLIGLLVGKPLGVLLASWAVVRGGLASLPAGATWRHLTGVSILCGIGFTMSIFVGTLAFEGATDELSAVKVGILVASALSGVIGGAVLAARARPAPAAPGR